MRSSTSPQGDHSYVEWPHWWLGAALSNNTGDLGSDPRSPFGGPFGACHKVHTVHVLTWAVSPPSPSPRAMRPPPVVTVRATISNPASHPPHTGRRPRHRSAPTFNPRKVAKEAAGCWGSGRPFGVHVYTGWLAPSVKARLGRPAASVGAFRAGGLVGLRLSEAMGVQGDAWERGDGRCAQWAGRYRTQPGSRVFRPRGLDAELGVRLWDRG